ncbi:MAG TPA: TagF domain-containing protein [Polyangiales bacterium]|nr:TagF domain-containing protein [Polyangiales bacterium]
MTALFGKLPDSPEFVREGAFGEPEAMVEAALLTSVERGRAIEPSRFLVAGPGYVRAGAWIPSHDSVGRAFPLALSLPLSEQSLLSIVPLHYDELLDMAVQALHARLGGGRGTPYLLPPHPSLLLPRIHRAREALRSEGARRFQLRTLGALEGEPLLYALSTLLRAAALEEPVALALPNALDESLFAWLELMGSLAPTHALSLIWGAQRAWIGWDMELGSLLAQEEQAWPLASAEPEAVESARAHLGDEVAAAIERDWAMESVLELVARASRCRHAG